MSTGSKAKKRIPLFDLQLSREAKENVQATVDSGWLSPGARVKEFERKMARRLKVKGVVGVSSGTAGLHLVLASFGGLAGREVITTPYTFVATIEAILQAGGMPVLADIDPETLTIDPDEVERKLTKDTAAVVPVDVAGYPCDYNRLNELCEPRKLLLVSDAAHAVGTRYRGKSIPHWCDAATYSLYSNKNLAAGEGGFVATQHEVLAEKVRLISRHGLTSAAYDRRRTGGWEYDVVEYGYKANLSEIHAAIGLGELKALSENQRRRVRLFKRYRKNLGALSEFVYLPPEGDDIRHGRHLFIVKLHLERLRIGRNRFIREMGIRGIECGVHYKPIFELSWYREALQLVPRFFPNAVWAWERAVTLPLYPTLDIESVDTVCEAAADVCRRFAR